MGIDYQFGTSYRAASAYRSVPQYRKVEIKRLFAKLVKYYHARTDPVRPFGALMGLTIRSGQTHVQCYLQPLLSKIEGGEIDPSFVVTHHASLEDAPAAYEKFQDKTDGCIKVVLTP